MLKAGTRTLQLCVTMLREMKPRLREIELLRMWHKCQFAAYYQLLRRLPHQRRPRLPLTGLERAGQAQTVVTLETVKFVAHRP